MRGQVAFASSRGSDAPPLLVKAARQFEPLDARLARGTYLDALATATFAGRLALGGGMREAAEAARAAPPPPGPARPPDLLLDGLARLTAWAGTRRRWQPRSGRAMIRLRSGSPAGRSSS
jgi:hypothetical protein